MPNKVLFFFTRKAGISPSAFKAHFENNHVRLIQSLAGDDFPTTHTRAYPSRDDDGNSDASVLMGGQDDFNFDAVATVEFDSDEHFQRFMAHGKKPEVRKQLQEDDENFSDPTKTRAVFLSDVCVTKNTKLSNGH